MNRVGAIGLLRRLLELMASAELQLISARVKQQLLGAMLFGQRSCLTSVMSFPPELYLPGEWELIHGIAL